MYFQSKTEQAVQGLQAFAFCVVNVNSTVCVVNVNSIQFETCDGNGQTF